MILDTFTDYLDHWAEQSPDDTWLRPAPLENHDSTTADSDIRYCRDRPFLCHCRRG